jgi:ferredoxin-NADP reductase
MQPPHRREVQLLSNEEVAPSLHVLKFAWPEADPVSFEPGQYVTFYLQRQGKQITRSYSFFSSANHHDRFTLLVKKVPRGFGSTYLCNLSPLERPTLKALAPLGKFIQADPGDRTVVLVATGTGLAPFVPMLERIWKAHPRTPTWLFFGSRYVEELVDLAELRLLQRVWPNFHFVPVVSRPLADGSWTGAIGHVQKHVRAQFPDLSRADVYLCGVNEMVNEMQEMALQLGCPKEHVFVERYGEDAETATSVSVPLAQPA